MIVGIPLNPYRLGSKLHDVYKYLQDGSSFTLVDLTNAVYFPGAGSRALYRQRVASAMRTIRKVKGVCVFFDETEYCMRSVNDVC